MKKFFILSLLSLLPLLTYAENNLIEIPVKQWKAWGNESIIDIKVQNNEITFRRRTGKDGWNTPMYNFPKDKQPSVTALTFLSFEYKVSRSRRIDININNGTEGTQYATSVNVTSSTEWKSAKIHLNSAAFKRGGKSGIAADGMLGDKLAGFQIAYSGKEITIRNVVIYEADPNDPGVSEKKNPAVSEYIKNRPATDFRQLHNGAQFPFGVIHALRQADKINGEFFGQDPAERTGENLRLIRCAGFNSYANFCELNPPDITNRLKIMEKYDLYLLETATSSAGLAKLPADHRLIKEITNAAVHPRLLAFYGQDEPTDIELFLRNKKLIEKNSAYSVPVTSAIHMMSVAKEIGPAMDIITIDPYSLSDGSIPNKTIDTLSAHATLIKNARQYCAGKRVWMVGQAFSLRVGGKKTLRFPTAAELRFDVFNAIASGANGYFAFIWQDQTAYLRADSSKGESFDQTICDPWGNLSEEGKVLGETGRRIVPVMSFFLDRKAIENPDKIAVKGKFNVTGWSGEYGRLFIVVNRDLENKTDGKVTINLAPGEKLYDLDRLAGSSGELSLLPGDGGFLLAAAPEKFALLKKQITARKEADTAAVKRLIFVEPAEFKAAREAFGAMHRKLMNNIRKFDGNPEMDGVRQEIKKLAAEYFDALREYRKNGKIQPNVATLPARIIRLTDSL